ncbi:hypothetical protein [Neisseria sp. Ec49-e6-T10]|uniref:hypothetical protein n=1 Tax=Neisseria sp. Ec49-e6-T10 TaxID=3140744 RepID=UPI003EBB120A
MKDNQTTTIKVLPVGMDERKSAVLRAAFRMYDHDHYELVSDTHTHLDVAIVDLDSARGVAVLDEFLQKFPDLPVLAASVEAHQLEVPLLPKPIRVETLFPALKSVLAQPKQKVQKAFVSQVPVTTAKEPTTSFVESESESEPELPKAEVENAVVASAVKNENASVKKADFNAEENLLKITKFDPDVGLLGCLKSAQVQNENIIIFFQNEVVLMALPEDDMVLLAQPLEKIRQLCLTTNYDAFDKKRIPIGKALPKLPSIRLMNLLWQLAVWTAQGRLVKNIKIERPLILKAWPNFTRVALIPDAMRITAFLIRTPVNLSVLCKVLQVDLTSLLNFLAAVYVTDFLVVPEQAKPSQLINATSSGAIVNTQAASGSTNASDPVSIPEPARPRSMLQRLLKKLSN